MEVSLKRQFSYGSFTTERFLKIIRRNGWSFSKDCLYYQLCLVLCSSSFSGCKACSSFPLMYKQVWEGLVNISYYFMVLSASHLSLFTLPSSCRVESFFFDFHFLMFCRQICIAWLGHLRCSRSIKEVPCGQQPRATPFSSCWCVSHKHAHSQLGRDLVVSCCRLTSRLSGG